MKKNVDVLIVGLGANGSAAAWHLSRTGVSVCGIDRFHPPHQHGSSHGQSRIIRQAYYESPLYVPFLKEAYKAWQDIEQASGKNLFLKTGGIMIGKKNSALMMGSRLSAETYGIPYEYLNDKEIVERYPAFRLPEETVGILEKEAGILFPEACIEAFLDQAKENGAELHYNEKVMQIISEADAVQVITDRSRYTAGRLIISAGAWLKEVTPDIVLPLKVERQVLYWFKNRNEQLQKNVSPDRLPVYIFEYAPGKMFYGFPDLGDGIKIADHHSGQVINPDDLQNDVSAVEIDDMRKVVNTYFNIEAEYNYSTACMYTNTPDEHFILDVHPQYSNIFIASPCSGHGFKFASITGKILSDLVLGNRMLFDLSPFRLSRFKIA